MMYDISALARFPVLGFIRAYPADSPRTPAAADTIATDRVDLSDFARISRDASALAEDRAELIARVRAAIARSDYDTDEKLSIAIESLLREI
ncbi:MAG: hypothetical protein L6Q92_09025 [Phycisphaerae bacterium]|nr:hypothetical protein [Phycisphaerae bacterium]